MKKIILSVMAVATVMLGIASCSMNANSDSDEPKVLDLRNKKADGNVLRAARAADAEFKAELLLDSGVTWGQTFYSIAKDINSSKDSGDQYIGEASKAEIEKLAENVKITSHADGFQLEFTAPEGFGILTGGGVVYVDGLGYKSTGVEKENAVVDGKLSVVYPLVRAGETAKFWIHLYGGKKGESKEWEAQLFYNITPVNGHGCVDDFPKNYEPANYVHLEDGHFLKVTNTIPPTAKNLKHTFILREQDAADKPWGAGLEDLGEVYFENASEEEISACAEERATELTIDLTQYLSDSANYKYNLSSGRHNKPYMFAMFWWTYTLDDVPGYVFSTPGIDSNVIENTDFRK